MNGLKKIFLLPAVMLFTTVMAQNYQAIHGSSYAGSMGVGYNPASIVHVPYAWDITPFSLQLKQSTNAFKIKDLSLLSFLSIPDSIAIAAKNGIKKRFIAGNQDVRIFNTRISLSTKTAIAFGINIRNYFSAVSSKTNAPDTLLTVRDFMKINAGLTPLNGEAAASAWTEGYVSFAHSIITGDRLLNAGITLKITRAIAGGYAAAEDINYSQSNSNTNPGFDLTSASLRYGYSTNFDKIDSNKTAAANRKLFLAENSFSWSIDAGLEYIFLTDEDKTYGGEYAYDTKIGIALMDIGRNKFTHSERSRMAVAGLQSISDTVIENKFSAIASIDDFNDSLATITSSYSAILGEFFIYQPARILINIDKHIAKNYFINAELTIPLRGVLPSKYRSVKDLNLIAVTPRWELKLLGVYLPVLLNQRNQLWVGGAVKAGPLLLGTHNLANIFAKNKLQTGGLYLAFTYRPSKLSDRQAHYAKEKLSKKERKRLSCPAF